MPASLHDAYLQAAMADAAVRTAANQHDQALAALGVHPANALHQSSAVPMQHGLGNAHDFGACLNDSLVAPALQSDYNDAVRDRPLSVVHHSCPMPPPTRSYFAEMFPLLLSRPAWCKWFVCALLETLP